MKTKLLMLLLLIAGLSFGQKRIKFYYDDAGNQITRVIEVSSPRGAKDEDFKNPATLLNEDFIQDDKISYYPNPVREELYVNWKNKDNNIVNTIELYNLNGQLLKTYPDLKSYETATINFQSYPEGFYEVVLFFENGTQQTLKIVKK